MLGTCKNKETFPPYVTRPGFEPASYLNIFIATYGKQVQTICHESFPVQPVSQLISTDIIISRKQKAKRTHSGRTTRPGIEPASYLNVLIDNPWKAGADHPPRIFPFYSAAEYLGLNHPLGVMKLSTLTHPI
jgi:hypothetical protein